MIKSYEDWIY